MLRRGLVVVALAMVAGSLAACSNSTGSTRTVQVDFNYSEFAGSFLDYFPSHVTVRPGMTVRFDQTWTGAPHTVTFVDQATVPQLPRFFEGGAINQDAAQPCYVKALDALPRNHAACPHNDVRPAFDGTYAYYSSGLILPTGKNANRFDVDIAKDAKEGTYFYYCSIHGVPMGGDITISKTAKVASQKELNRTARNEAQQLAAPVLAEYRKEKAGKATAFKGNLAGSGDPSLQAVQAEVNEFTPRTISAKVGAPVMWTIVGNHSISFNVPAFAPLYKVLKNGTIAPNGELDKAQGGWPGAPPGHKPYPLVTDALVHLDAGAFDGSGGLKSSGIGFNTGDTYSVTFTKRGTYAFACLIHAGMIGKVVVK